MRALITGATSGIGKEMAFYLHRKGWQLVLTGRNEEMLKRMARKFGSSTKYIALDLANSDAPQKLYDFCKDMRIDFLINNAGFGIFGEFSETSLDSELELLDVNIRSVHILTKLFLRDFEKRGSGYILNVSSVAGFMTGPLMSSYYASKNYVVRLTLAIREELRRKRSNVTVSVTAKWTYGSYNATGQCTGSITIDGTKYSFSGIKFKNTSNALSRYTGSLSCV